MLPRTLGRATTLLRAKLGPRQFPTRRRDVGKHADACPSAVSARARSRPPLGVQVDPERTAPSRKLGPYQRGRDRGSLAAISGTGQPANISTRSRPSFLPSAPERFDLQHRAHDSRESRPKPASSSRLRSSSQPCRSRRTSLNLPAAPFTPPFAQAPSRAVHTARHPDWTYPQADQP